MKNILRLVMAALFAVNVFGQQPTLMNQLRVTSSEIIGTNAIPASAFQVVDTGTATPRGIVHDQYNNGTNSSQFNARKARGTYATPLTIVTGDVLGRFIVWGHDGSNFIETANIRATSSGTIAATRVPSQMEFYTSTNALPSVLTLAATINSAQQFVNNVGSAALPSYTFAGLTTDGFYSVSSGKVGVSIAGALAGSFQAVGGGGLRLVGSTNTSGIDLQGGGGIVLAAAGTAQNIALTPSTTGYTTTSTGLKALGGDSSFASTAAGLELAYNSGTSYATVRAYDRAGAAYKGVQLDGSNLDFQISGTTKGRFAATTGNLLLGGLTTDGTGVLQFPTATTSAGGITMGNVNLYQSASGVASLTGTLVTSGYVQTTSNNGFIVPTAGIFQWNGRSAIASPADGIVELLNSAQTDFTRLQFGGTTSSFPSLKRSTTYIAVRLADDSGDAKMTVGQVESSGTYYSSMALSNNWLIGQVSGTNRFTLGSDGSGNTLLASVGKDLYLTAPASQQVILQSGGSATLTLDSSNNATFAANGTFTGNAVVGAAGIIAWTGRGGFRANSDGVIQIANAAATDFTRLQFGGTTSSFPAIKRTAATFDFRLADDSNYADIRGGNVTATSGLISSNDLTIGAASNIYIGARSKITSPADGTIKFTNNAGTTISGVVGTTTNDSAAAGNIGEVTTSTIASGSAVSLTTNTAANVTSISLTAGDWDVFGFIGFAAGGTTTTTYYGGSITSTSATITIDDAGYSAFSGAVSGFGAFNGTLTMPVTRFSVSGTTTVYLVVKSTFAVSTNSAYGRLTARRMR